MRPRALAAWVGGALLAAGVGLLLEPLRQPVFAKFSLGMVSQRPAAQARGDAPPDFRGSSELLAPDRDFQAIASEASRWFPTPDHGASAYAPADSAADLLDSVASGEGECSRWTEALMLLCHQAGRACREWANIAYPETDLLGHAVVDVWIPELERWAMLDVFLGFWPRGRDGLPLAVPEFERAMRSDPGSVELVPLRGEAPSEESVRLYYADPRASFVEIVRNDPSFLLGHWTRRVEQVHKPLGQLLQWALRIGPGYLVPEDAPHRDLRRPMQRVRARALGGVACVAAGSLLLLAGLVGLVGRRAQSPAITVR